MVNTPVTFFLRHTFDCLSYDVLMAGVRQADDLSCPQFLELPLDDGKDHLDWVVAIEYW